MGDFSTSDTIDQATHGSHPRPLRLGRLALHVGIGLLCLWLALEYLTASQELVFTALTAALTLLFEAFRFRNPRFNAWILEAAAQLAHSQERRRVTSATWFWLAMFLVSLIQNELVFALTLGVLSLGDQVAGVVGRQFGSIPLPNGRSLEGTLAFIASSSLICAGIIHFYFPEMTSQNMMASRWLHPALADFLKWPALKSTTTLE